MTVATAERRLRRFDPVALGGVWARETALFSRLWRSNAFGAVVEPTIFLLAFGFGLGALVADVAGIRYLDFVGTGIVATAVLFATAFDGMFTTFVRRKFQRTYDALLAAPIDVEEIVTAESLWKAGKGALFGLGPLLVAVAFGLRPGAGVVWVPAIAAVTGFGFACLGTCFGARAASIETFNYVISAVFTPIYLVAGTFFPIDGLPRWAATVALANPLYHCVQLVRSAVFGTWDVTDLAHLACLLVFALVTWRLAVRLMERALID